MSQKLSIILPVYNVATKLDSKVRELLDVITDLTSDFEVMIVDDGSTDDTEEVSMELDREYPQVRVLRHAGRKGPMGAARAGIAGTRGDIVLIHDIQSPISGQAIQQLWEMRNDDDLVFARSESRPADRVPPSITQVWSGTQMLRRDAVHQLQDATPRKPTIDRITRTDVGEEVNNPTSILRQLTDPESLVGNQTGSRGGR